MFKRKDEPPRAPEPVDEISFNLSFTAHRLEIKHDGDKSTELIMYADIKHVDTGAIHPFVFTQKITGWNLLMREQRIALVRQCVIEFLRHEVDENLRVNGLAIFNPHNPLMRTVGIGNTF